MFRLLLSWALAAVLAGCGSVAVNDPIASPAYVQDEELYAARGGALRVEVAGDTFGLPPERFADLVVDTMRNRYYRRGFFTREASRATDPRYRVVMMFNPYRGVSGHALCAAPQPYQPAPRAPGERTSLLAAFCGGPDALSETNGWAVVSGPDDPRFAELVMAVTNTVFPRVDQRRDPKGL
jgi:hypothetical protein